MPIKLKPINEQTVVVFGASSGIGRLTALDFAARGARVVVAARSEAGLRSLVSEIEAAGGTATYAVADARDFDSVDAVAERAIAVYNRLDTWVHAASVFIVSPVERVTPAEFRQITEVNLAGAHNGILAAMPRLRRSASDEAGAALIVISSVEGKRAIPLHGAYAATKHGIIALLDALRLELRREGVPVSVTNILPAGIDTPIYTSARTKIGVAPNAPPPVYDPQIVSDAILYAAENPVRDLYAGGGGRALEIAQSISPRLVDELLLRAAFPLVRTNKPKSDDAPTNLFTPLENTHTVRGGFGDVSLKRSAYTWLATHKGARRALVGVALGTAALLASRAARRK